MFNFHKILGRLVLMVRGRKAFAKFVGVSYGVDVRLITTGWGTEPFLIKIGNRVTVADGVRFLTHDGSTWLTRDQRGRRYHYAPIEVGDDVFIGVNSIIMPGVKISNRVVVAAGSVVTKSIPPGVIVAGVPAKIIGSYEDFNQRNLTELVSEAQIDFNLPYKERIERIVSKKFKSFLK